MSEAPVIDLPDDEWPKVVRLVKPLKGLDGEPIVQLELHEPTLGRLKAIDGATGRMDEIERLLVKLCRQPPKVVRELGPRDLATVSEILGDFLQGPSVEPDTE